MKRSEMILLIAESLVEPRHSNIMKEAKHILTRIENRGMLPPYNQEADINYGSISAHTWEAEGGLTKNKEKRVLDVLDKWQNSKLDINCAREVIAAVEGKKKKK